MKFLLSVFIVLTLSIAGCGSSDDDDDDGDRESKKSKRKPTVDLSTKENAIRTIHQALLNEDKDTFRKCVSAEQLEKIGGGI